MYIFGVFEVVPTHIDYDEWDKVFMTYLSVFLVKIYQGEIPLTYLPGVFRYIFISAPVPLEGQILELL
jgi:hypothetical protein